MADISVGGRARGLTRSATVRIARAVLRTERRDMDLSVSYVGERTMRRLNFAFKQRDRATDVLAFELSGPARSVGDIYICPVYVRREAARRGIGQARELSRVLIHGILHVLGYDHDDADRESGEMWRRQERYVRRFA